MASANDREPIDFRLEDHVWKHRVVLLFAESAKEPSVAAFHDLWNAQQEGISDRDLLLVESYASGDSLVSGVPMTRASSKRLRTRFEVDPDSTVFILIGKDGSEKLREKTLTLKQLFETIDVMPMRRREMWEQRSEQP